MIALLFISTCFAEELSLTFSKGVFEIAECESKGSVHGSYQRRINETGWNFLRIWSTDNTLNDTDRMYAMGFIEGYLTRDDIDVYWDVFVNTTWKSGKPNEKLMESLLHQRDYWRRAMDEGTADFYTTQRLINKQLIGLYDGYLFAGGSLNEDNIYLLASRGDLFEMLNMFPEDEKEGSFADIRKRRGKSEVHSCSAFIKNINGEVFFAHNTWTTYTRMLRIKKRYEYETIYGKAVVDQTSYPAIFVSIDDYYSLHKDNNTMFIMETTNSVYDEEIYIDFRRKHLYWQRVLASLIIGGDTNNIIDNIGTDSSGTYNNQWMIFDLNKWNKNDKTGSLMIFEEMPGLRKRHDVTQYLLDPDSSYSWASYNIPYDRHIFNLSGLKIEEDCDPYSDSRRSIIFKRDLHTLGSIEDIKKFIRYNNYMNDEYSAALPECDHNFADTDKRSPMYAIASRGDLLRNPEMYGAIDAKVMRSSMPYTMYIISGPTNDIQKTFRFSDFNMHIPGIPDKYDFKWLEIDSYVFEDKGYTGRLLLLSVLVILFVL